MFDVGRRASRIASSVIYTAATLDGVINVIQSRASYTSGVELDDGDFLERCLLVAKGGAWHVRDRRTRQVRGRCKAVVVHGFYESSN